MTIGVRKLLHFSLVWAGVLLAEAALLVSFVLTGNAGTTPHLLLSGLLLLAAIVIGHLVMFRPRPQKIPVLMYHSVADSFPGYPDPEIVMSTSLLERQLAWLKRRGYETLHLHQLQDGLLGKAPLPRRAVSLTFDDGMLDNWVHVYPLLRKYDMKATFFIATDFIEEGESTRPTLEDVWQGGSRREDLRWDGYLQWNEIKVMQESGLVEFQPHGCTHDWAFISSEIIDFHHPGDPYYWLSWLERPERKSSWLGDQDLHLKNLGRPVYRFERSMVVPSWIEDQGLRACCENHVRDNGGGEFFNHSDWRAELLQAVREYRQSHPDAGRMETADEYRARVLDELQRSRQMLQARTGGDADYFCWPGEQFSADSLRLALDDAGYRAVTCEQGENSVGGPARLISRKIAQEVFRHAGLPWLDGFLFAVNIKALEGNYYAYLLAFPLNRVKDMILRRRCSGGLMQAYNRQAVLAAGVSGDEGGS